MADSIILSGTLTLPNEDSRRFPAVILISGSGQDDRDYTAFKTYKPFKEIAEYLSTRGIAVLRVDDRNAGEWPQQGPGYWSLGIKANRNPLIADLVQDVRFGIDYLKTRREIDPDKIGLIGHSLGSIVASGVATQTPVAFIISMAGPVMTGKEFAIRQAFDNLIANGLDSITVKKYMTYIYDPLIDLMITHPTDAQLAAAYPAFIKRVKLNMNSATLTKLGLYGKTDSDLGRIIFANARDESAKEVLTANPAVYWLQVKCPVLALFTAKDRQVNAFVQAPALQHILEQSQSQCYQVIVLSGLNHSFRSANTGSAKENSTLKSGISETVLKILYIWLNDSIGQRAIINPASNQLKINK
jgi:dienelactone hydrolase